MAERPPVAITIGMPVRNAERFITESLDSLLSQTFEDFELIISDNASTDATEQICTGYAARDSRIRYERLAENRGAAANYNRLVHLARGRYFKWAAHDDVCAPSFLSRCYEELETHPAAVLAYPRTLIVDEHGSVVREYEDGLHLDHDHPRHRLVRFTRNVSLCNACFGLIRRDGLLQTDLIAPYPSSDVTLLAQLALLGQCREIPERLFRRRIHSGSSRQGDHTLAEVATWFDPRRGRRPLIPPTYRVMLEVVRSIARFGTGLGPTAVCMAAYVSVFVARRVHIRGSRIKRRLLRWASSFATRSRASGRSTVAAELEPRPRSR